MRIKTQIRQKISRNSLKSLRGLSFLFFLIFFFFPLITSAAKENTVQKEAVTIEHLNNLDSNEVMVMLDQACKANDKELAYLIIGALKGKWKSSPPFDDIINGILDKTRSREFRFIMIDALGAFKRSIDDNDAQGAINILRLLIEDKQNSPEIRAMTITRLTSIVFLFLEKGVIDNGVRTEYCSQLLAFLRDENESMPVRNVSASGLAKIQDKRAVPVLLAMLQEMDHFSAEMQRSIVGALGVLRDRRALLPLSEVLKNTPYRQVYGTTAYSLGLIGTSDIVEPLVENISRFDTGSCKNALKRNEDLLLDIVDGKEEGPLIQTIKALGVIRSTKAIEPLAGIWRDSDLKARKEIVETLCKIGGPKVKEKLIEFNEREDNKDIKGVIHRYLNRLEAKEELSRKKSAE